MSIRAIAQLIPQEYRKEILELNVINSAQAIAGNESMQYLEVIWKNYVEKDFEPDCNLCHTRVLKNFHAMKNDLIKLEREYQLMNSA